MILIITNYPTPRFSEVVSYSVQHGLLGGALAQYAPATTQYQQLAGLLADQLKEQGGHSHFLGSKFKTSVKYPQLTLLRENKKLYQ